MRICFQFSEPNRPIAVHAFFLWSDKANIFFFSRKLFDLLSQSLQNHWSLIISKKRSKMFVLKILLFFNFLLYTSAFRLGDIECDEEPQHVAFSTLSCSSSGGCKLECKDGYKFPRGEKVLELNCLNRRIWGARSYGNLIPDCECKEVWEIFWFVYGWIINLDTLENNGIFLNSLLIHWNFFNFLFRLIKFN